MYIVAKTNQTAMAFVARAFKERPGWIILHRLDNYKQACTLRNLANGLV